MWLTVAAPSIEAWSSWFNYSEELEVIKNTDYSVQIETSDDINTIVAQSKGLTLSEYKKELCEEMREDEIAKLDEKFGIKVNDDEVDVRKEILSKYNKLAERLDSSDKVRQMYAANKLFERPDQMGE